MTEQSGHKRDRSREILEVGQMVHSILYGGRTGVITRIIGEQSPDSAKAVGPIGVQGGNAHFRILFGNGSTNTVPEALVRRSVQWEILDEVLEASEYEAFVTAAERRAAEHEAEVQQRAEAHAAEYERLRTAPETRHLEQSGTDPLRAASKNLKRDLAHHFPGIGFSVRKRSGRALDVQWIDGPRAARVRPIAERYQGGHFDGMTDSYEANRSPFNELFGYADYVFTQRDHSPALIERAITRVFDSYAANLREVKRPDAEDYRQGALNAITVPGLGESLQSLIREEIAKTEGPEFTPAPDADSPAP